jgi:hypothetical protein
MCLFLSLPSEAIHAHGGHHSDTIVDSGQANRHIAYTNCLYQQTQSVINGFAAKGDAN